jgi:hypothetical protein
MFDYQAGEKYKLTLIMVGIAGVMAGMFFMLLLAPSPEPRHSRPQMAAHADNPDLNGGRYPQQQTQQAEDRGAGSQQAAGSQAASAAEAADPETASTLVQQWLPLAWDLSAGTAKASQEAAILYMTADCASAYRKNIWTPSIAKQIDDSGIKSTFKADQISAGNNQSDGSVVIFVEGQQILSVPGKGSRSRHVKLEYLVKSTAAGLRIAGISEGGHPGNQV